MRESERRDRSRSQRAALAGDRRHPGAGDALVHAPAPSGRRPRSGPARTPRPPMPPTRSPCGDPRGTRRSRCTPRAARPGCSRAGRRRIPGRRRSSERGRERSSGCGTSAWESLFCWEVWGNRWTAPRSSAGCGNIWTVPFRRKRLPPFGRIWAAAEAVAPSAAAARSSYGSSAAPTAPRPAPPRSSGSGCARGFLRRSDSPSNLADTPRALNKTATSRDVSPPPAPYLPLISRLTARRYIRLTFCP